MSNTQVSNDPMNALIMLQNTLKALAPPDLSGLVDAIENVELAISILSGNLGGKLNDVVKKLSDVVKKLSDVVKKLSDVLKVIKPGLADNYLDILNAIGGGIAIAGAGVVVAGTAGVTIPSGVAIAIGAGVSAAILGTLNHIDNKGAGDFGDTNQTTSYSHIYGANKSVDLTNYSSIPLTSIGISEFHSAYKRDQSVKEKLLNKEANELKNTPFQLTSLDTPLNLMDYNKSPYFEVFATNKSALDSLKPLDTSFVTKDVHIEDPAKNVSFVDLITSSSNSTQAKSSTVHNITNHIYNIDKVDVADGIITDLEEFFSAIKRKAQEARYDLSS